MKVVICSLNSKYIHSSLAPWCLLAGIREYSGCGVPDTDSFCDGAPGTTTSSTATSDVDPDGLTAVVVEGTINEPMPNVARRIIAEQPDVVGLSCYIWNIGKVYEIVNLLRKSMPNVVIVLGGPEVSYNTREVLEGHSGVDYVISGEGEIPFALLCRELERLQRCGDLQSSRSMQSSYNIQHIPGIASRGTPTVDPYVTEDIPPSPYTDEYFKSLNGRIAYLETSRGCPFRCAFCLSGRCGGARFYPLERAKSEILLLANSGTKTIKLVDRTFNADKKRAREIWKFIIENCGEQIPKDVCFHFEIAGDLLDDESLELLKTAPGGLIQFEIGVQSFNEDTLCAINRKTDMEKLCRNIRTLIDYGNIHVHIDLIAGLPKENYSSFQESFNTAYALRPHMLQLGFLKLLYGADMREYPDRYPCKFRDTSPYEVQETPWISANELEELKRVEDVVDRIYNSARFRRTIGYLTNELSVLTPFDIFQLFSTFLAETKNDANSGTEAGGKAPGVSLDQYTEHFFLFLKELSGKYPELDFDLIRDLMVEDRLTTNASGRLPACLKVYDERLRSARIYLENETEYKSQKGIKRAVAILYAKHKLICVDYTKKDPVSGEYKAMYFDEWGNSYENCYAGGKYADKGRR